MFFKIQNSCYLYWNNYILNKYFYLFKINLFNKNKRAISFISYLKKKKKPVFYRKYRDTSMRLHKYWNGHISIYTLFKDGKNKMCLNISNQSKLIKYYIN